MTQYFTEDGSAEVVNARMGSGINPRLKAVMDSLVRHLHAFAKDVDLRQEEWDIAIDFLTKTGQICSDERQEYILLSDVLGFSMLVDAINNRRPAGATENTVFGPFHVADAPIREMGDDICLDGKGERCLFEGKVVDRQRYFELIDGDIRLHQQSRRPHQIGITDWNPGDDAGRETFAGIQIAYAA